VQVFGDQNSRKEDFGTDNGGGFPVHFLVELRLPWLGSASYSTSRIADMYFLFERLVKCLLLVCYIDNIRPFHLETILTSSATTLPLNTPSTGPLLSPSDLLTVLSETVLVAL
jgi:hypothetical protein